MERMHVDAVGHLAGHTGHVGPDRRDVDLDVAEFVSGRRPVLSGSKLSL